MRDLKQSDHNILTIKDAIGGGDIELHYRMPLTSERVAYLGRLVKRKNGKIQINAMEARIEFGLKILTGFREGDFGFDGKPISSDPGSKNYCADWKDLIRVTAADILNTFAFTIFEGASVNTGFALETEGEENDHPLEAPSVQS